MEAGLENVVIETAVEDLGLMRDDPAIEMAEADLGSKKDGDSLEAC